MQVNSGRSLRGYVDEPIVDNRSGCTWIEWAAKIVDGIGSVYEALLNRRTWIQGNHWCVRRIQERTGYIDDGLNNSVGVVDIEIGSTDAKLGVHRLPVETDGVRAGRLRLKRRIATLGIMALV